jgi:hypothetical protein
VPSGSLRDPVMAMLAEWPRPPREEARLSVRLAWMERMAVMFDQIAFSGGGNGLSEGSAIWAAEYMRRKAKELAEKET